MVDANGLRKSIPSGINAHHFPSAERLLHERVGTLLEKWQLIDIVNGESLGLVLIRQRLLGPQVERILRRAGSAFGITVDGARNQTTPCVRHLKLQARREPPVGEKLEQIG